jgi:dihydrofolate reductase
MPKVRVAGFSVSLDGFSAGIEQSLSDPLGKRGTEIFQWFFRTKSFCAMHGQEVGVVDTDDEFARRALENFGAFILGRNMFGPVRGPWLDHSWKGWWGDNPPYHAPTFVLTHYEREPLVMEGGTTFYFVSGGIEEALRLAKQAAGDKDVKIGGGVSTSWADRFSAIRACTGCTRSRRSTVYRSGPACNWFFGDRAQSY